MDLKKSIKYLPYGVGIDVQGIRSVWTGVDVYHNTVSLGNGVGNFPAERAELRLHPVESLVKEIEIRGGEKIIPILSLAGISAGIMEELSGDEKQEVQCGGARIETTKSGSQVFACDIRFGNDDALFAFSPETGFYFVGDDVVPAGSPHLLYEKLHEWGIEY